jgi:hypothetical protein
MPCICSEVIFSCILKEDYPKDEVVRVTEVLVAVVLLRKLCETGLLDEVMTQQP